MNIFYVDYDKFTANEVCNMYQALGALMNGEELLILPMYSRLISNVNLDDLYEARDKINKAIEEKENES